MNTAKADRLMAIFGFRRAAMSGEIKARRFTEVAVKCGNFETCGSSAHGQYATKTDGLTAMRDGGWKIIEHRDDSATVVCNACIDAALAAKAKRAASEALLKKEIAHKKMKLAELRKGKADG